jgi:hypothetical protein
MMNNTLARDHAGRVFTNQSIDCDVDFCDYIIINGIRFNRESNMSAIHRVDYEPNGKFADLVGVVEH